MNSPETPLYSKGQVLFNMDKARLRFARLSLRCWWKARWTASRSFLRGDRT